MSQPLVSVIVPVHNAAKYLRRCVESILKQTSQCIELILVDDGSTDVSGAICDEYAVLDQRVKSLHLKNSGVSAARNYGLEHTGGQYIVFVDADDLVHRQMIEKLNEAVCDGADMAICSCRYITDESDDEPDRYMAGKKSIEQKALLEDLYYLKKPFQGVEMTAVWGKMYRRSLVEDIRFDPLVSVGEDFLFNYQYISRIQKAAVLAYRGYDYRINRNGVMHSSFDEKKRQTFERIVTLTEAENENIGFVTRMVNIAIVLLLMVQPSGENAYITEITDFIKQYRTKVLMNRKARLKVRVALALSYGGFERMMKLYRQTGDLMQRLRGGGNP